MEEQMKLFETTFDIKAKAKKRWPFMFHLTIIEPDNEFHIWQGGYSLAQAKKIAAKKYNRIRGFSKGNFVKFSEDYEEYKKR
jgi:hypothetical protein